MSKERLVLAEVYSPEWVAKKTDAQVIAIFKRLQRNGKINV